MRITRVYADAEGESHFAQLDIPLRDAGPIGRLSEILPATGVIFRENDPDYDDLSAENASAEIKTKLARRYAR